MYLCIVCIYASIAVLQHSCYLGGGIVVGPWVGHAHVLDGGDFDTSSLFNPSSPSLGRSLSSPPRWTARHRVFGKHCGHASQSLSGRGGGRSHEYRFFRGAVVTWSRSSETPMYHNHYDASVRHNAAEPLGWHSDGHLPVMGDCLRKRCRSVLENGCPRKGNLDIFYFR